MSSELTMKIVIFFLGVLIGLKIGLSVRAYPTEPRDWYCTTATGIEQGYQLCKPYPPQELAMQPSLESKEN